MDHRYPLYKSNPSEGAHRNKQQILRIPLPPPIAKHHHNVEIAMDFFFSNGTSFLNKKIRKIYFRSVLACNSGGKSEIKSGLKQVKAK